MEQSLYIHIPFCKKRCSYCDFNTYAGRDALIPAYQAALIEEIRIAISTQPLLKVQSIYFGGGTPSILDAPFYAKVIGEISALSEVAPDCEITLEANPGTLDGEYLRAIRSAGVNRLSLGVQSMDSLDLARLDRIHGINDVLESVRQARRAQFDNLSLDMIFGMPWQSLDSWQNGLDRAILLQPEHFSLYSLIIETGTPLYAWYQKGWVESQDEDREADMFEYAMDALEKAGFVHYEISNWARQQEGHDFQSRHNRQYWLNRPYFGFGAGAHGYVNGVRTVNALTIPDYIQKVTAYTPAGRGLNVFPASVSQEAVDMPTQMRDFMLLGLRLVHDGVSADRFETLYGQAMDRVFKKEINQLLAQGLVEWVGPTAATLRLTRRGVFLANRVFREFV